MDRRNLDPNDRPSIFSRPEEEEPEPPRRPETTPRSQDWHDSATRQHGVLRPPEAPPPTRRGPVRPRLEFRDAERPRVRRGLSRHSVALGTMGLAILALLGFIGFSMLGPGAERAVGVVPTASPTSTPADTPEPTSTPELTPEPTATPIPTPEPTPVGPPVELAVGGWATVTVDELHVRASAGSAQSSLYRLVRGAVVHVAEGPATADAGNWYRVASLGGAKGWVSSGWSAEPHLDTIAAEPVLSECGQVRRPVYEVVAGSATPNDVLRIGGRAVPSAAFSTPALAAIELMRGMNHEVCFSGRVGNDGTPLLSADLSVGACGRAEVDGGVYRLVSTDDGGVSLASQVIDPTVLHPVLLDGGPADHRMSANLRTILAMMANPGTSGCVHASVTQRASATESYRSVSARQCSIVHRYNDQRIDLSPASGGPTASIKLPPGSFERGRFALETPIMVTVDASVSDNNLWAGAWPEYGGGCD